MGAPPLHCPACRKPLEGLEATGPFRCPRCRVAYPVIGSVPIVVPRPVEYLAHAQLDLARDRQRLVTALAEVKRIPAQPGFAFRRELMTRLRAAMERNLALLDAQATLLAAHTTRGSLAFARARRLEGKLVARAPGALTRGLGLEARHDPTAGYGFEQALEYLRTDWGGSPAAERQVATLGEALRARIEQYCGQGDAALYLGAGLGRHAFEGGAHFASVLALELSFPAASLFSALRQRPLTFSTPNWHGATSDADLVQEQTATFRELPQASKVRYVVGDARSLPVGDASVDAVVALFFTDVLPASTLFPEVRRVLRPGGRFVGIGPLHYHFNEKTERLTQPELRSVIETDYGFALEPDEATYEVPYLESAGSQRVAYRIWDFVATRLP